MIVTGQRLTEAGRAMFGDDWEGSMASRLGVSRKTIRRYSQGKTKFNPKLRGKLFALIESQWAALTALRAQINVRK